MATTYRIVTELGGQSAPQDNFENAVDELLRYIEENPGLVTTIVELETGTCRHCDAEIIEKVGWILYKWIHLRTGAHLCWMAMTRAEPKEDT